MSALSRARTWSTNRHEQETARRGRSSTATSFTAEQKTISTHVTTVTEDAAAAAAAAGARQRQEESDSVAHPSFLQPRVAALLGVSKWWHPILFGLRLLSILPSIYLGFPLAIRFLLKLHAFATSEGGALSQARAPGEDRLLLTETMLAIVWCGCSGYLSFFFTDCFMSRWLINYTPSATAFRLVSVSALNGYLQSWTLYLSGSSQDPFLLLPTWIIITSTLTMVYHVTQRKINILKETSTSISVFSMASYISMVALLIEQHWDRTDWLELPFVALGVSILRQGGEIVVSVAKHANITAEP
ncbi:N-glycosylation protein EOS1 [Cytospora mali]|uniref:N-glycosylation protein EOS1 n=1 Tax=Cytospora mali TaxID=578113 RepID=A0A194VN96_CYTMA|nr:N-glycosylation protein EOS1 [Valsa mali]